MNNIKATKAINEQELKLGIKASWHDDYKDSAYIYVGGLDPGLTEGDIITIFSQYGEPVDINLPKEKPTSDNTSTNNEKKDNNKKKSRGFCFLMYENQLSTNLAVDNLNGAVVLGRTLRVDHCKNYKQLERNQDGKMVERDGDLGERLNARPELHSKTTKREEENDHERNSDGEDSIDPEDPMAGYLREQRRKRRAKSRDHHHSRKHSRKEHETEQERALRKKAKRLKKSIKLGIQHSSPNDKR